MIKIKTLLELSNSEIRFWAIYPDIYELHFDKLHNEKQIEEKFKQLYQKYFGEKKNALEYFYNFKKQHIDEELIKDCILTESIYDKFSGILNDELMKFVISSKKIYDKNKTKQIQKFTKQYSIPLKVSFTVIVARGNDVDDLMLDGKSAEYFNGVSGLKINILLNPKDEPSIYNEISGRTKGIIQHELEHKTQEGINRISDRPQLTDEEQKMYADALESGDFVSYFTNRIEIPAYIKQMYSVAKYYKKPINLVIDYFLEEAVKAKYITKEEMNKIKNIWETEIKKRYSGAKFQ